MIHASRYALKEEPIGINSDSQSEVEESTLYNIT